MTLTRDGTANGAQANIAARSQSWFDFTPQAGTSGVIELPMVDGNTGVYHFNVGSVGPDVKTSIDPDVAVGYIYQTGLSDPNFASVTLPNVGDGIFELLFGANDVMLNAGVQFFFPAGGVSKFTVKGIETSAGLDPVDTAAFVTGLTFLTPGSFTGTMTPITEFVPDPPMPLPGSLALLGIGLAGLGWSRRSK